MALLLFLFGDQKVLAKSYSIDKVDIRAEVKNDGSMDVMEDRLFNFNGDYTFAYEYIEKAGNRDINYILENIELCDDKGCYQKLYRPDDNSKIPATFYVKEEKDSYYVKWFYKASNEKKNFKLKYTVKNAVTTHQDVAELYWQLVGSDWEIGQKNILAEIKLPAGISDDQIKAWGHGPLNGIVSIPDLNTVTFKVDSLNPGTFFEGRIIMPKEIFDGGVVGSLNKSIIEDEEINFQKETLQESNFVKSIVLTLISIFLGLIGFVLLIVGITKFYIETKLPEVNLSGRIWEPPSDIDPAQVNNLLVWGGLDNNSFTATILALVQKRYYKIFRSDNKEGLLVKKYKYYLIPENKKTNISPIEEKVVVFLNKIGIKEVVFGGQTKQVLSFDELVKWCQKNSQKFLDFYNDFKKVVTKENLEEGFFDENLNKFKNKGWKLFGWISAIFFGQIIITIIGQGSFAWVFSFVQAINLFITLMIILAVKINFKKKTDKGKIETAKWKAFKKHMEEYSQTKNYPIDSIILWEKYLVYGVALGVSTKAISQLPINLSDTDKTLVMTYWGGNIGSADFSSDLASITSAISSISNSVNSSYGASGSGSSGGFSGGGG